MRPTDITAVHKRVIMGESLALLLGQTRTLWIMVIFAAIVLIGASIVRADMPAIQCGQYCKPNHSESDVMNVQTSGCATTSAGIDCTTCDQDYQFDCLYYTFKTPNDCKQYYSGALGAGGQDELAECAYMVYYADFKDEDHILETCNLVNNSFSDGTNQCLERIVPAYAKTDTLCANIVTWNGRDTESTNRRD